MKTINELIQIKIQNNEERQKENPNVHIQTKEELLKEIDSSITPRYKTAEIIDEKLWEKIIENLKDKKGIYLFGAAGTGKTYLLYAICRRLIAIGYPAKVKNFTNFLADLRKLYTDKETNGEESITDELQESGGFFGEEKRILLLDDLGVEKSTEWNIEILYRLINYRYEYLRPTFFASNLSLQELAEKSGDRIASRIAEMCEVVNLGDKDRRIK